HLFSSPIALSFSSSISYITLRPPSRSPLFPYTTLFRSAGPVRRSGATVDLALQGRIQPVHRPSSSPGTCGPRRDPRTRRPGSRRSEEHTSELQSRENLVCRLLLEKKKKIYNKILLYNYI